jgi:hypothetical protein
MKESFPEKKYFLSFSGLMIKINKKGWKKKGFIG